MRLYADELESRRRQAEERAALKKSVSDLKLQILAFILANIVGSLSVYSSALSILEFLGVAPDSAWMALPAAVTALFFLWLAAETVLRVRELINTCKKRDAMSENNGKKEEKLFSEKTKEEGEKDA